MWVALERALLRCERALRRARPGPGLVRPPPPPAVGGVAPCAAAGGRRRRRAVRGGGRDSNAGDSSVAAATPDWQPPHESRQNPE